VGPGKGRWIRRGGLRGTASIAAHLMSGEKRSSTKHMQKRMTQSRYRVCYNLFIIWLTKIQEFSLLEGIDEMTRNKFWPVGDVRILALPFSIVLVCRSHWCWNENQGWHLLTNPNSEQYDMGMETVVWNNSSRRFSKWIEWLMLLKRLLSDSIGGSSSSS